MGQGGVFLIDNDALKEFLKISGVFGGVPKDSEDMAAQTNRGVAALEELLAFTKAEGLTIVITDVVEDEATTAPDAYGPDAAVVQWLDESGIVPVQTETSALVSAGTRLANRLMRTRRNRRVSNAINQKTIRNVSSSLRRNCSARRKRWRKRLRC